MRKHLRNLASKISGRVESHDAREARLKIEEKVDGATAEDILAFKAYQEKKLGRPLSKADLDQYLEEGLSDPSTDLIGQAFGRLSLEETKARENRGDMPEGTASTLKERILSRLMSAEQDRAKSQIDEESPELLEQLTTIDTVKQIKQDLERASLHIWEDAAEAQWASVIPFEEFDALVEEDLERARERAANQEGDTMDGNAGMRNYGETYILLQANKGDRVNTYKEYIQGLADTQKEAIGTIKELVAQSITDTEDPQTMEHDLLSALSSLQALKEKGATENLDTAMECCKERIKKLRTYNRARKRLESLERTIPNKENKLEKARRFRSVVESVTDSNQVKRELIAFANGDTANPSEELVRVIKESVAILKLREYAVEGGLRMQAEDLVGEIMAIRSRKEGVQRDERERNQLQRSVQLMEHADEALLLAEQDYTYSQESLTSKVFTVNGRDVRFECSDGKLYIDIGVGEQDVIDTRKQGQVDVGPLKVSMSGGRNSTISIRAKRGTTVSVQ